MNNPFSSTVTHLHVSSKSNILALICLGLIELSSCTKDFVETDISNKTITLLAPADSFSTATTATIFWWETVEGASKYHLQIAKPSFSTIQQLMLDTNVAGNHFSFSLSPGTYQWRVKGFNGSSKTGYVIRTIIIDSTANISSQLPTLISPIDNYNANTTANKFKWDKITGADEYRFQLTNNNTSATLVDVILKTDSVSYTLGEGIYTWKVRAQNAGSNSFYANRTITVDITAPSIPTHTSPANADSSANPVSINWSRSLSAIADSLFIYPDSLVSAATYKGYSTNTNYSFTGTVAKYYYWRLKSVDAAGNWSGYSTVTKFKVKK